MVGKAAGTEVECTDHHHALRIRPGFPRSDPRGPVRTCGCECVPGKRKSWSKGSRAEVLAEELM